MEESTIGRGNKKHKKRKAGSSPGESTISLDGRPVSLKQHFLNLSEDLLL